MFSIFRQYLSEKAVLTDEEFDQLQAASIPKKLRKRQYLIQEGDVWQNIAFVCKGCLRIYHVDEKGSENIMWFAIENSWAGDYESYTKGVPAKCYIDALEATELLLWNKDKFDELLRQIPALREFDDQALAESFIASQNRIHASITFSAEQKYYRFLKDYPLIANRVPQHMIASFLGISPETLSRVRGQIARK